MANKNVTLTDTSSNNIYPVTFDFNVFNSSNVSLDNFLDTIIRKIAGSSASASSFATSDVINTLLTGGVNYGDKIVAKSNISSQGGSPTRYTGYIKFASGLIINYGHINTGNGTMSISFLQPYTNVNSMAVVANPHTTSSNSTTLQYRYMAYAITLTGFSLYDNNFNGAGTSWIAIGM